MANVKVETSRRSHRERGPLRRLWDERLAPIQKAVVIAATLLGMVLTGFSIMDRLSFERPKARAAEPVGHLETAPGNPGIEKPAAAQGISVRADRVVVIVTGFRNRSGRDLPRLDALAHAAGQEVLTALPGVSVVTRDRLKEVALEQDFSSKVAGNRSRASRLGRLLGADYLLTGEILAYDVQRQRFEGYEIRTLTDVHSMTAKLELIDLETAELVMVKTLSESFRQVHPQAATAPAEPVDQSRTLLVHLIRKASDALALTFRS